MILPLSSAAAPLLGLCAAVSWGGGDFSGGMAVKCAGGTLSSAVRVVLVSHLASLTAMVTLALLRGEPPLHGALLLWSLAAGLAGGGAVICFYIALAAGEMGSSAALSGLLAAAIPAGVSAALEGAPGWRSLAGFLLAATAIWLIAAGASAAEDSSRRATVLSIAAGAGFGVYFVALRMAGRGGLLWPLAGSRIGSLSVALTLLLVLRLRPGAASRTPTPTPRLHRSSLAWALGTALLDTGGNLFFLASTRAGRLDVASVLASLYPASTILLAACILRERPTRRQAFGMLVAVAAVVLITV